MMTLNHVSDKDIVECLQNCPELDGPLFDVNVLEELCLSDELWNNLNLPDSSSTQNIYRNTDISSMEYEKQGFEEIPGLTTPPYSPPTPSPAPSASNPLSTDTQLLPSGVMTHDAGVMTQDVSHILSPSEPSTTFISPQQQQPSTSVPPEDPSTSKNPPPLAPPGTATHSFSPSAVATSPKALSTPAATKEAVSLPPKNTQPNPAIPQNLSSLNPQILSLLLNGSLQVLKSGEIVPLPQVQQTNQTKPLSNPHINMVNGVKASPIPGQQSHVTVEAPVIGQKRPHSDSIVGSIDTSKMSKKQQRMIKNRESACISRQKKRQYMDSLEARLKEAAIKNSALLNENTSLRKQVSLLEQENKSLRVSLSRSSSPFSESSLKKPALVMMVVLCFSISLISFLPRGFLHDSSSPLSSNTALTHVKSRALLSVKDQPSEHEFPHTGSHALVPVYSEISTELERSRKRELERIRRRFEMLKMLKEREEKKLPAQNLSVKHVCSCPVGNDSRKLNLTSIQLMNKEMTGCFKLNSQHDSFPLYNNEAHKTSLTILNSGHVSHSPSYHMQGPQRLYQDFKKYIPRDLDNYYLLSLKDHVLLYPSRLNSTHSPFLSVFVPADSDFTSLLQMDCEVLATKIVRLSQ